MTSHREVTAHELDALLLLGLRKHVFPGAVCAVGRLVEPAVYSARPAPQPTVRKLGKAGKLAAGEATVGLDTPYDLASLTKSFVAITALRLAQQGLLDVQEKASRFLPELAGTQGGESSLAQLLSHRAGLLAVAPLYQGLPFAAGSTELKQRMLMSAATLVATDVAPGQSLYSDLGYIIAGEAIARAAGLSLDEVVRREVTAPLGIDTRVYYAASLDEAAREQLRLVVAPTEACALRGRLLRGEVHDENCHAYGGISGHAGLFGTAEGVLDFGLALLTAWEGRSAWLDQKLLRWALTPHGEGYLVGFDQKSREHSSAGDQFSERSFGHLGFTGTSLWCDPIRRLCAVLLSNRVYPTRNNIAIRAFRPRFHDAAAELTFKRPL